MERKGTETETMVDQYGIEVSVTYDWEREPIYLEECHGYHSKGGGTEVTLKSVEVIFKGGDGVDLLPMLNEQQQDYIIQNLCINS